ncbi:hypothetical protein B0J13DRAFT_434178 [Dactylonectria estremocensis]|uniref:Rhodopsin domain-containing protein n=1 Tax=Dactylonectria estremocensis TaxID=1079267 RepID=A0A9P9JBI1_9HYPO|nr:hypothetical protein B0J13DRAFT_434178 [Dactylonectria estremocensis]
MDPLTLESFIYYGISLFLIIFRIVCRVRRVGIRNIEADDYLMLFTIIPYTAETTLSYQVSSTFNGLSNSDMTREERASLSPSSDEYRMRVSGSKVQLVIWVMWLTIMWMIKASICVFYGRLTAGIREYKLVILFGYGFILVTYIGCMTTVFFSCWPLHKLWQINPDPGNTCHPAVSRVNYWVTMTCDIATYLYVLLIPIPLLWKTQLPLSKKISLSIMFSGGIFVIVSSVLNCVLTLQAGSFSDRSGSAPRVGAAWSLREIFVALTTTNLPMTWGLIRPKVRLCFDGMLSSISRANCHTSKSTCATGAAEATVPAWVNERSKSTVQSAAHNANNDMFTHQDASSDDILPSSSTHMGGIKKEVAFRVSMTDSQMAGQARVQQPEDAV